MQALVAVDGPLYPCRSASESVASQSCAVMFHMTGSEAEFLRRTQHIRTAGAERRSKPLHCFSGCILDDSVANRKLLADTLGPLPEQRRMGHRVVPQQMAALMDCPGNFRTPAHKAADQEEGRTHLVVVQQIE